MRYFIAKFLVWGGDCKQEIKLLAVKRITGPCVATPGALAYVSVDGFGFGDSIILLLVELSSDQLEAYINYLQKYKLESDILQVEEIQPLV